MNKNSRLVKGKKRQGIQNRRGMKAVCLAMAGALTHTA